MAMAGCGFFPHETEDGGVDPPGRDGPVSADARSDGPSGDARPIDAPPPSDASPDAPPIDAPPPSDGPPAEPFTLALAPPPVVARFGPNSAVLEIGTITNHLARRLNVDFTFTGAFRGSGRCTNIAPQGTCSIFGDILTPALGPVTGTVMLAGGGLRKTVPLTATVQAFVEAFVLAGQGTTTISPPPTPGCDFGGCYAPGSQVTVTATAAPNFAFTSWNDPRCSSAPTCTVTAGVDPIRLGATFTAQQIAVQVEITGGLGEVGIVDSGTGGGICNASCTLTVAGGPLTVYFTTPGYILSIDGVPTHISGALRREYPDGASTISASFGGEPGELELAADDAEFGPNNELALRIRSTIIVYNQAMVAQWSAAGDKMAFTPTGELYIQDGPAHTTKYASNGMMLFAADTALGFVTPSGGMLVPIVGTSQFSILDASLTVVSTLTIAGQFGGLFPGCVAQNGQKIFASGHQPGFSTSTYNLYNLDGELTFQADRDFHDCHTHPTYHGDFVLSTFHPVEMDVSVGTYNLDDLQVFTEDAFDAAVDGSDNLYWTYAPYFRGFAPERALLRKYVPPSKTPVWTIERDPDSDRSGGVIPSKLAAAPDGRVAWIVRWIHPVSSPTTAVLIFPAGFTGPANSSPLAPDSPRR